MKKAFVGLSCTGHDGALAIMQDGRLLFAEAAERYYQNKFAINQAPDDHYHCRNIIKDYVEAKEIILAKSWSERAESIWVEQNKKFTQYIDSFNEGKEVLSSFRDYHLNSWSGFLKPNIDIAGHGIARAANSAGIKVLDTKLYDHHLCHAAFGVYGSAFKSAAVAVLDGQGEGTGTAFWHYRGGELTEIVKEDYSGHLIEFYASLGLYYGIMVCLACNFEPVAGEEWKIMGLAPYGKLDHDLYKMLQELYRVDGLTINCTSASLNIFVELIKHPVSHKKDFDKAANYAFTFQRFYADIVSSVLNELQVRTGEDNLILTGGCALNSSYNGRVLQYTKFKNVYVPSAPADDGNAAGAAILASNYYSDSSMLGSGFQSPYLGSEIVLEELEAVLENSGCLDFKVFEDEGDLCREVAELLASGNVVAWVQGRAEFGPRALGNRSILADPRDPGMKEKVNQAVKFREGFRPFAPSILDEYGHEYFSEYQDSPYMERTLEIRPEKRDVVPAVCHADGTGRLQSVTQSRNPLYHKLIKSFYDITGVPVLMNTSLNVMGRPIVHSGEDAILTFLGTQLDNLAIGKYILYKNRGQAK